MNKKILILIPVAVAGITAYWQFSKISSEIALMERFPDIHPDDVIAAHRRMLKDTFRGKFADVDTKDEELMDRIFLSYVNNN